MNRFNFDSDAFGIRRRLFSEPRCNAGIAIGLGAAALAGTVASSVIQSNAQKKAAKEQAQSQQAANDQNYQEFLQSRGSEGNAILPMYLNQNGQPFEQGMGQDLIDAYNQTATGLPTFQSATSKLAPAQSKAEQFTNDIFNGGITSKLLSQAAPVQAARVASARQSSLDALNKTLDAIDAAQAGKGFSGDAFGNRNLRFQANLEQNQAVSAAQQQNLAENQQIRNYGDVTLPMQNLNLPASMASQAGQFAFLPQSDFLQSIQSRQAPFNFLRLPVGSPPAVQPLPTPPPTMSIAGAVAQGVGQLGGSALDYYLGQRQQQQQFANEQALLGEAQQNAYTNAMLTNAGAGNPFGSTLFNEPTVSPGSFSNVG